MVSLLKCFAKIFIFWFIVSSIAGVNKSLWCDFPTTAVHQVKTVIREKLGFLKNLLPEKVMKTYIEQETARLLLQCWKNKYKWHNRYHKYLSHHFCISIHNWSWGFESLLKAAIIGKPLLAWVLDCLSFLIFIHTVAQALFADLLSREKNGEFSEEVKSLLLKTWSGFSVFNCSNFETLGPTLSLERSFVRLLISTFGLSFLFLLLFEGPSIPWSALSSHHTAWCGRHAA